MAAAKKVPAKKAPAKAKAPVKAHVGDTVTVPAGVAHALLPGGAAVTVRAGSSYRFNAPGQHVLGDTTYDVTK